MRCVMNKIDLNSYISRLHYRVRKTRKSACFRVFLMVYYQRQKLITCVDSENGAADVVLEEAKAHGRKTKKEKNHECNFNETVT